MSGGEGRDGGGGRCGCEPQSIREPALICVAGARPLSSNLVTGIEFAYCPIDL